MYEQTRQHVAISIKMEGFGMNQDGANASVHTYHRSCRHNQAEHGSSLTIGPQVQLALDGLNSATGDHRIPTFLYGCRGDEVGVATYVLKLS